MGAALAMRLPEIEWKPEHPGTLIIVGAGASLKDELETLRNTSGVILACNAAHDFLIDNGIKPHAGLFMDATNEMEGIVREPVEGVTYYCASMTCTALIKKLKPVILWHAWQGISEEAFLTDDQFLVTGGSGVALRALNFGYVLGFRRFHMFGVDACFKDGADIYQTGKDTVTVTCAGRDFQTLPSYAKQANDFVALMKETFNGKIELTVHGDGLIQHIFKTLVPGCSVTTHGDGLIPHLAGMIDDDNLTESLTALHAECTTGDPASEQSQS